MPTFYCELCLSPFRDEIVALFRKKVQFHVIYDKYSPLMKYDRPKINFRTMVKNHIVKKHNVGIAVYEHGKKTTIEAFGTRMLELGMAKIEGMTPGEVALKDVIQAQKLVLDSKKLKLDEGAMMIMLGKLFGPTNLMEGEVVEENR